MKQDKDINLDDELQYINFSELYTTDEIKALTDKNRKKFFENSIWGINKGNFFIYTITFCISFIMIMIYLLVPDAEDSKLLVVLMSVGASAIGAAILACFIEHSNYVVNCKQRIDRYNNSIVNIYNQLWLIFANRSYKYLSKVTDARDILAQRAAKKFVIQYSTSITDIDDMLLEFSDIMDDNNRAFYQSLKEQLVRFISDIENSISTDDLITLLDGTKNWLRTYFSEEKLKGSLFVYEPKIN